MEKLINLCSTLRARLESGAVRSPLAMCERKHIRTQTREANTLNNSLLTLYDLIMMMITSIGPDCSATWPQSPERDSLLMHIKLHFWFAATQVTAARATSAGSHLRPKADIGGRVTCVSNLNSARAAFDGRPKGAQHQYLHIGVADFAGLYLVCYTKMSNLLPP